MWFCTTLIDLYAPDSPGSSVCCLSPPLSPLGIETICKPFKTSKGRPIIITPITEQVKTIGEEPVKPLSYMERLKEARKEAKRKLHQPKKYQCDRCGKILGSLYTLKLHNKNRHPKEAKWLCDSCDYKDFTSRGLRRHIMRNHKPVTRYECETCGKTFGFKGNLNQHRKTHVDDLFICPICQKSFKYKLDYTYHVKKHSPDYIKNQCVCEVCSKVYADARDLKRHLVTHFSAKKEPQVCDECGKSFMKLRHHKKRCHETEKRYVCEHCGRGFAYIDDLKPHVRKHTGEKPFICEVCGKNFAHSSGLKAHRNVHMKKPKTDKDEGKKQDKQT